MSPTDTPSPAAKTLLARLQAQATRLDSELQGLPQLPVDDQQSGDEIARQLDEALRRYWNAQEPHSVPRHTALIALFRQGLYDEVALKIEDGQLSAGHRHLLPEPGGAQENAPDIHALYLGAEDAHSVAVQGALVFSRNDGPCLLYLPGLGIESFTSVQALRSNLLEWLNDKALGNLLLRNTRQEHQDNIAQIDADPELSTEPYTTNHIRLLPIGSDPFELAIKHQILKQRDDVAWACRQQALREQDTPRWRLGIQQALDMRDLLGPAAMLRRRDNERQQREIRLQAPEWLRNASAEERQQWLDSLNAYEQTRLILHSMMQGCASITQFATTRLAAHVQNELGYDLDPEQVQVTTQRHSPIGNEPYRQSSSLSTLALQGLHSGDLDSDSDFQNSTGLSLDGLPLQTAYPQLTAQWVARTVARLDLRATFGEAQRHILGNTQVKAMMGEVMRRQIAVQARTALYQGHILPTDFNAVDTLLNPSADQTVQMQVQQLRLDTHLMGELLLLRIPQTDVSSGRLILFARNIPREQALLAVDNERQLLHELINWFSAPPLRQYLLEQLPSDQQSGLAQRLLELSAKAQPADDLLTFIDQPSFADALYAMTTAHIRIRLDEQRQHTPDWFLGASTAQRQELQSLDDAIVALERAYRQQPHALAPDFEQFVHQYARRKINTLLGQPEGTVDPDRIIITSPRETLSYTLMLRNGYDDSIGFLNAAADSQATFSGPEGVDLSALTPENVAASVRGAWPSDVWVTQVEATLLNPQHQGYDERRRISLLLVQLQMRRAALHSLLTHRLNAAQYAWLKPAIDHMHHNDSQSRQRYPVYPLQFRLDNPFVASGAPVLGDIMSVASYVLPRGVRVSRVETAQGCYILCPEENTAQALLYTPNAPDGLAFRPLHSFIETLRNAGMSDYYKDRCHRVLNRFLAFYFIDLKNRTDSPPPALPERPYDDLHEVCYNRVLQRKLRDVQNTTEGRGDMIASMVMNSIEILAVALTLPFPPASFVVGAALALRDGTQALVALGEGDKTAASLHVLTAWLNLLGAAGDASVGLKGFGGLLRQLSDRGGHNPALAAVRQAQSSPASLLRSLELPVRPGNGHTPLFRAPAHDPQKLLASGYFTQQEVADLIRPFAPEGHLPVISGSRPPAPAHAVRQSLDNTTPIEAGHARGVTLIEGHYYIELQGLVYEVQYNAQIRLWQIIDPANPYAFFGKQPVYLTDSGHWKALDGLHLRGGGGSKFTRLGNQPASTAAVSTPRSATSAYELPEKWKYQVMGIADNRWMPIDDFGMDFPPDYFASYFKEAREVYSGLREKLRQDAVQFFEQATLAAKSDLPVLDADISADGLIKAVFERSPGLVISEAPQSIASKRMLIENMPRLVEQNVEIIYIEHLFTDLHVPKLQKYLAKGSKSTSGSAELKYHLDLLNRGRLLNDSQSKHDYYHLIKTAHRHGIEVRPLSSSVSYDFLHSTAPVANAIDLQKMSVFFGTRVISADTAQAPARRWVALLEHTHATAHQQVPGIAELHGAISIRVEDVANNRPVHIARDTPSAGTTDTVPRADFRVELPTAEIRPRLHPHQDSASASASATTTAHAAARDSAHLDHALTHLMTRHEPQPLTEPLHSIIDSPGQHGFELDLTGHWQRADQASWPTTHEPTALQRSVTDTLYQMPDEHLDALHELAFFEKRGLNIFYTSEKEPLQPARELFFKHRARLLRDAQALSSQPLPPRPELPDVTGLTSHSELLDTLYAHTEGLVIGEYHSSIASKQFIIDNLPHLASKQVRTLYLEHLQIDMHQLDLDLFAETGKMSKRLLHYLKHMDRGFFTDPARLYNFEQLVIKAREHGIEVRALDCAPGYYLGNMPNPSRTDRLNVMNYFASRLIRRHQQVTGPHKWLALVGETHTNTFEKTVPGLAELEQGISLRVFDLPHGESFGPAGDPGRLASDQLHRKQAFVRSDYALGLPTPHGAMNLQGELTHPVRPLPAAVSIESRLYLPGRFTVEGADTPHPVIIHRSRANRIERTPILKNAKGKLYIDRASWQTVHLRPFESLAALLQALRSMNMTMVS